MTLRFYGIVDVDEARSIAQRVASLSQEPIVVALEAWHGFPRPGRARALAVLVSAPARLLEWRAALVESTPCETEFRPHITLARTRGEVDLRDLLATLDSPAGREVQLAPPALYASRPTAGGSEYVRVHCHRREPRRVRPRGR